MGQGLVANDPAAAGRLSGAARRRQREEDRARLEARLGNEIDAAADALAEALRARVDDEADHRVRIAASDRVTNRLFGMPAQETSTRITLEVDIEAARDKLAALLERQDGALPAGGAAVLEAGQVQPPLASESASE